MAGFLESTLRRRFGPTARVRYYREDVQQSDRSQDRSPDQPPDEVLPLLDLIRQQKRELPIVAVNGRIVSEGVVLFDPVIAAVQTALATADSA